MNHRVLTGITIAAALALAGSAAAHAQQVYLSTPAPVYVAPAPYAGHAVVVAPSPYYGAYAAAPVVTTPYGVTGYVAAPAYPTSATVVDPVTGRRCTVEASGYRWCWTP